MDFTTDGILERMKSNLKNEDSRMEGSFTMDNLQTVSEELAKINAMLIIPLQEEITEHESDMGTSGNEKHYIQWAKEVKDASGNRLVGNAKVNSPRDGSGSVYIAIVTSNAIAPTEEEINIVQNYIDSKRPVGAEPVVSAAEGIKICIVCYIKIKAGYSESMVKKGIQSSLQEYFLLTAFQSGMVSLNFYRVSSIVSGVDGVKELIDLKVNGTNDSIVADYNKYFSFEEFNLYVIE